MDIFVGSLSFKLKESELREAFEKYGKVSSAKIIIDKITRQSKGFGFVEMPDESEARLAISALNGADMYGRPLVVNESQKREPRPGGSTGGGFQRNEGRRDDFKPRTSDTPYRSESGYTPRPRATESSDDQDGDDIKETSSGPATSGASDRFKAPERRTGNWDNKGPGHFSGGNKGKSDGNKNKSDGRHRSTEPYVKKGGASRRDYFESEDDDY